jgi:hypothetical protein
MKIEANITGNQIFAGFIILIIGIVGTVLCNGFVETQTMPAHDANILQTGQLQGAYGIINQVEQTGYKQFCDLTNKQCVTLMDSNYVQKQVSAYVQSLQSQKTILDTNTPSGASKVVK